MYVQGRTEGKEKFVNAAENSSLNPLVPGPLKGHTYLNKAAAESCRCV